MKVVTIQFNGINYQVSAGDVFQAKFDNGLKGQIFIVQCNDNEKVTLEVVEKISNRLVLVRVNNIEWGEEEHIENNNYKEVIKESSLDNKPLSNMTKKELVQFSEEHNLDVDTKLTKAKLLAEIKKSL